MLGSTALSCLQLELKVKTVMMESSINIYLFELKIIADCCLWSGRCKEVVVAHLSVDFVLLPTGVAPFLLAEKTAKKFKRDLKG